MFSGIIEHLGTLSAVAPLGGGKRLDIEAGPLTATTRPGDSIAVNGVCLTATAVTGGLIQAEAVSETLSKSNLGELGPGSRVNLERPLEAGGRIHGHWVLGHVDAAIRVSRIEKLAESRLMSFELIEELRPFIVPRASVAIDGVSLTVARLEREAFTCSLIGFTLSHTTLGLMEVGRKVNIETDIIGKYVFSALGRLGLAGDKLSEEKLRSWGY